MNQNLQSLSAHNAIAVGRGGCCSWVHAFVRLLPGPLPRRCPLHLRVVEEPDVVFDRLHLPLWMSAAIPSGALTRHQPHHPAGRHKDHNQRAAVGARHGL